MISRKTGIRAALFGAIAVIVVSIPALSSWLACDTSSSAHTDGVVEHDESVAGAQAGVDEAATDADATSAAAVRAQAIRAKLETPYLKRADSRQLEVEIPAPSDPSEDQ